MLWSTLHWLDLLTRKLCKLILDAPNQVMIIGNT